MNVFAVTNLTTGQYETHQVKISTTVPEALPAFHLVYDRSGNDTYVTNSNNVAFKNGETYLFSDGTPAVENSYDTGVDISENNIVATFYCRVSPLGTGDNTSTKIKTHSDFIVEFTATSMTNSSGKVYRNNVEGSAIPVDSNTLESKISSSDTISITDINHSTKGQADMKVDFTGKTITTSTPLDIAEYTVTYLKDTTLDPDTYSATIAMKVTVNN